MTIAYTTFTGMEHPYQKPHGLQIASAINLRTDPRCRGCFEDCFQQGQMGSCVANATAACYLFELRKHNALNNIPGEAIIPSRLFIYYNARTAVSQIIADRGCFIRHAFRSLAKYGVCSEASWPYDKLRINEQPPDTCFQEALGHRISTHERLDVHRNAKGYDATFDMDVDGHNVLENLRSCLSDCRPVVFNGPNGMWQIHAMTKKRHSKVSLPKAAHAVLAVGYDDNLRYVLCQNSMGVSKSLFWIPYDWITDFYATSDFWTMKIAVEAPK
ncbi:hypothetical protein J3E74DRAFT_262848 [Bipolaris maydis]|nr:hypothetical protein J3E74DRAFT_262848 [Bipolaris maydis]